MLRPVEMRKAYVLVLDTHLEAVTRALGRCGVVHLVNAVAQSRLHLLQGVDRADALRRLEGNRQKCRDLMERLDVAPDAEDGPAAAGASAAPATLEALEGVLDRAWRDWQEEDTALGQLLEENGLLVQRRELLGGYPGIDSVRLRELRDLRHLYLVTGRVAAVALPDLLGRLGERALVLQEPPAGRHAAAEARILLLSTRRNRFAVDGDLAKAGFREEPLPADADDTGHQEQQRVTSRLAEVRRAIDGHRDQMRQVAERWRGHLLAVHRQLQQQMAVLQAEQQFGQSARLYCMTGWLPRERADEVRRVVARASAGTAVVELHTPGDDEAVQAGTDRVPVEFPRHRLLRPFQMLVRVYGMPRYEEVEPSLFVAISFVVMFGLMFGDVGQGAVLSLAGAALQGARGPRGERYRDTGLLLLFCGLSATVFGFLYGSVFGNEHLIRAYWLSPLRDVTAIFQAALVLGVVFISGGILINIWNKVRARTYLEGVLDRFGVIGIVFYWGAIGLGLKAMRAGTIRAWEILLLVVLPLALLFVREPLLNLLHRRKHLIHDGLFTFTLTAGMEVLETVTTFLGNTVSFVRLGAFALSHTALCMTVYILGDMLRELPGGGFWNLLVIILGNLFVIVLEGMVATIQGLRLQYYELFSKFFSGDGVAYQPFQLSVSGEPAEKKGEEER